jgi:aspartyl aminopeptidase
LFWFSRINYLCCRRYILNGNIVYKTKKSNNSMPGRLRKNAGGYRIEDPLDYILPEQLYRRIPVIEGESGATLAKIDSFAKSYSAFLDKVRTQFEVVDRVRNTVVANNLYLKEKDRWYETRGGGAFAIARRGEGSLENGINILFAHTDSPCLRLKTNSPRVEWGPDTQPLHLGVELDVLEHGGIIPHQWPGRSYEVRGHVYKDGKKVQLKFPVYVPDTAAHTDLRGAEETSFADAHKIEDLDALPGFRSVKEMLKKLKLSSPADLNIGELYVVPTTKSVFLANGYHVSWGHDSRAGIYSTVRALLDERRTLPKTTIVYGFDKEETGSKGEGGAQSRFFEQVLFDVCQNYSGKVPNALEMEKMMENSLGINADVDIGASNLEDDVSRIDQKNIAKLGYGPFLLAGGSGWDTDQVQPEVLSAVTQVFKKANLPFQIISNAMTADNGAIPTFSEFLERRGLPCIAFGVPVAATHSVEEIIHSGDQYYSYLGNRALIR